ncbi:MAG: FtsH protease activity modulator HflK [Alteromonadaceae bacterium]|nr:MAG: FtsH protease activity modulator HflK [Alteromonadaceae bacterium]
MAWNEPGGNNKDPWGGGNRGNDGPPDLDEVIKKFQNKVSSIFGGKSGGGGGNGGGAVLVALIAAAVVVVYIFLGFAAINEQERAVVLRLGKLNSIKQPGLRWNPPVVDSVHIINVTKVRNWSTSEQMLTEDLNIVDVKVSVQYVISSAQDFVLNVKDPESSLRQATNSALRHVVGSGSMHMVLTEGREDVALQVMGRLQAYLDSYKSGIDIDKVNIENSTPPAEVQDAYDEVIRAREDEERFKNEAEAHANGIIPEARGRAQRMREEAAGYRAKVIARAEGEAKRFEYLLAEYRKSPEVTRSRLYLDAVEEVMSNSSKVMIDVKGGNNMLYLPLDKMMTQSASGLTNSSGTLGSSDSDRIVNEVLDRVRREINQVSSRRGGR